MREGESRGKIERNALERGKKKVFIEREVRQRKGERERKRREERRKKRNVRQKKGRGR